MLRGLLVSTLALGLAACGGVTADRDLDDYLARLARMTNQPRPALVSEAPAYPRHRERAVAIPEAKGRLRDIGDYNRCNLTQLVAERNSILGRYWPPSQRLDYEWRFAHRLERCHDWLQAQEEDPDGLAGRVAALREAKAGALAAVWWRASYDSAEFEQHFSIAAGRLTPEDRPPLAALSVLQRIGEGLVSPDEGFDLGALESALQQLAQGQYGGRWLRQAARLSAALDAAAAMLEATDRRRLCPQGRPTPEARVFETVFYRIYAERVQPWLALTHQGGDAWLSAHEALWASQRIEPPAAMLAYRERALGRGAGSVWGELTAAQRRHTQAWQQLLGACGLMPGQADSARPAGSP